MHSESELKPFIWTMNWLGLLSCSYRSDVSECHFQTTFYHKMRFIVFQGLAQLIFTFMFAYWLIRNEEFIIKVYNSTGNIYLSLNFGLCCMLTSIIYFYFFIHQHMFLRILEMVLSYKDDFAQCRRWHEISVRQLYFLYLFLAIGDLFNNFAAFKDLDLHILPLFLYQFGRLMNFVLCGIVTFAYVSIVKVLTCCLSHVNSEIGNVLCGRKTYKKGQLLRSLMTKRKSLIHLCQQELGSTFGLLTLIIIVYKVFEAPSGPFYLLSVTMDERKFVPLAAKVIEYLVVLYWNVSSIVLVVILLGCNFDYEADKTAKILAKCPRGNSGVDKMITKFLLKNLRQKPILTAYGFFSLDKSTLFKLFTAVFTYMVILVQFKEMENNTKPIK